MVNKESVWLVGHKDSKKKKDYLAVAINLEEAERLLEELPGAVFIKEVEYESR